MRPWRTPGLKREEARAQLRPGNFQGTPPKGRSREAEEAAESAVERVEGHWFASSRYRRRARVARVDALTTTGTVRVVFEVVDGEPFDFHPGQFVGIEAHFEGLGYRRSPYCILSPPTGEPHFEILVRAVPDGPLSLRLAELRPGDEVAFRGPTGRSMVSRGNDRELVLLATGTGVAPFYSLARHLLERGYPKPVVLWWGLRLVDDMCLSEELDALAAEYPHFSYHVTLSQPPAGWTGLRGRVGESVPPLLETLGGKHYYLAGNGAMLEEMALVLSDLGVDQKYIYKEPYFNPVHQPDPEVLAPDQGALRGHRPVLRLRRPTGIGVRPRPRHRGGPLGTGRQRRPPGRLRPVRAAARLPLPPPGPGRPRPHPRRAPLEPPGLTPGHPVVTGMAGKHTERRSYTWVCEVEPAQPQRPRPQ